jgi:hypothetical protein
MPCVTHDNDDNDDVSNTFTFVKLNPKTRHALETIWTPHLRLSRVSAR